MAGKTKEERYILRVYEVAERSGDVFRSIDRYLVGQLSGLAPKGVDTICKELMRANFLRKGEEEGHICLTKRGEELAHRLLRGG